MAQTAREHESGQAPHDCHEHGHRHHSGAMDDETAEWYVENWGEHPTNRMTVEFAELKPDDVVLDIGCGNGTAVREAATRLSKGRAIGVDPTPAMLRFAVQQTAAHTKRGRIEFLEGEAGHLPLSDSSVTVAWAINSLHHWDDPANGLSEVRRVLMPGGRILIAEEELEDGKCGHGEAPLSDPVAVVCLIKGAGFIDVTVGEHAEGEVRMLLVGARRPAP